MWKATGLVLQSLLAVALCAISYGPCHDVTTVEMDTNEWPGIYYVNVMTYNLGARCLWVDRSLEYADGDSSNSAQENVVIAETFSRIENGTSMSSVVAATYAGKGHYQFSTQLIAGRTTVFEAYWLHFDLPSLDCHYVCSEDELLINGRGAFWCESASPDALAENACKIKEIAESNGFDVDDLMVVDNCDCSNISFEYESSCQDVSVADYFSSC